MTILSTVPMMVPAPTLRSFVASTMVLVKPCSLFRTSGNALPLKRAPRMVQQARQSSGRLLPVSSQILLIGSFLYHCIESSGFRAVLICTSYLHGQKNGLLDTPSLFLNPMTAPDLTTKAQISEKANSIPSTEVMPDAGASLDWSLDLNNP